MNAENVRDGKPSGVTTSLGFERVAGVEARRSPELPPAHDPADAFCEHFFRCFFCRVGDRLVNDYFCRDGRDLMVAMLDDRYEKERAHVE